MSNIKFGTDGWRAVISEDFTFENVAIVAQAIADFVNAQETAIYKKKKLAVGYDTRFLSGKYAEITACVLAANGINVVLSKEESTTPSVCVYIKDKKLTGGVMITASHNPPEYNGIKYKGFFGGSAGSDIIDKIEECLFKTPVNTMNFKDAVMKKKIVTEDFISLQLAYIKKYADMKSLNKACLRILVDSMNGTGKAYFSQILKKSSIKFDYMNIEDNPGFKGRAPEPNEKHLKDLMANVKKGKYDLGIATDGDSDRVAIVDEKGRILSGHKVMALLLMHMVKNRKMKGAVVQTICGTGLINKMCEEYNLPIYETPVGFKYICDMMVKKDVLVGGEETGGIGFKDYVPERDGFLSALLIIELMIREGKKISRIINEMNQKYGNYVYEREDVVFSESKRETLIKGMRDNLLQEVLGKKVKEIKDYDGIKFICEDGTWLLLRLSGTEPKLRIYSETRSRNESLEYLEFGKKYAFKLLK